MLPSRGAASRQRPRGFFFCAFARRGGGSASQRRKIDRVYVPRYRAATTRHNRADLLSTLCDRYGLWGCVAQPHTLFTVVLYCKRSDTDPVTSESVTLITVISVCRLFRFAGRCNAYSTITIVHHLLSYLLQSRSPWSISGMMLCLWRLGKGMWSHIPLLTVVWVNAEPDVNRLRPK